MEDKVVEARAALAAWHLGQTSERYESSNLGAGTISTGRGDLGGVSYGAYQLSSASGTLREYLDGSRFGPRFEGLTPATPAFDRQWREVARTDPLFAQDQHDFIGRSHFDREVGRLQHAGIDLTGRGRAVQDMLWSTAVQMRGLTRNVVSGALRENYGEHFDLAQVTDRQIIEAVQDYKVDHNATLFRRSPNLWPGLLNRARNERVDLLELVGHEEVLRDQTHTQPLPIDERECLPGLRGRFGDTRTPRDSFLEPVVLPEHRLPTQDRVLLGRIRECVETLDRTHNRSFDEASERACWALLPLAKERGMTHPSHADVSLAGPNARAGEHLFLVQGAMDDPAHLRTQVRTMEAMQTPVEASLARVEQINHDQPRRLSIDPVQFQSETQLQPAHRLV